MKFSIVAFGKSKFPFVDDGLAHYFEQIEHLADSVELVILKDQSSDQKKESAALLEALEKRKFLQDGKVRVLLLDERGKSFTSREFSAFLGSARDQGTQRFVFVVGGAYGFPAGLRERFSLISLSKMTFPHDLARLVLAEQVYRGLQILKGSAYHHD